MTLLLRQILLLPTVTIQSIYGAVSAYLMIGLMFAAFYSAINDLQGGFFAAGEPANLSTFQYFSFTTLTTLGYGDFTPVQDGARAVAMIEAMTGQIFQATLVARLVSSFRPAGRAAAATRTAATRTSLPPRSTFFIPLWTSDDSDQVFRVYNQRL